MVRGTPHPSYSLMASKETDLPLIYKFE